MENSVLCVAFRDCVLRIKNSQLSRVFKGVFHKTQKEQNTAKGLKDRKYLITILYNITGVSVANFSLYFTTISRN